MPISIIKGKVWKFGDNISTDLIYPHTGITPQERAAGCMRANRPEFAREVQPGDVIVAGKNFGCGSNRPAPRNFLTLGVGCVIAESFSRIFFRNAINLGFPLLYCTGVYDAFEEGNIVQANLSTGEVKNLTSGKVLQAEPLPEVAMRILNAGGIEAVLREEYAKK